MQTFRRPYSKHSQPFAERIRSALRPIRSHLHAVGHAARPAIGAAIKLSGVGGTRDFLQAAACKNGFPDLQLLPCLLRNTEVKPAAPHANAPAARFDRIDAPAVFGKSPRKPLKFLLLSSRQHGDMQTKRAEKRARKHG